MDKSHELETRRQNLILSDWKKHIVHIGFGISEEGYFYLECPQCKTKRWWKTYGDAEDEVKDWNFCPTCGSFFDKSKIVDGIFIIDNIKSLVINHKEKET